MYIHVHVDVSTVYVLVIYNNQIILNEFLNAHIGLNYSQ